MSESNQSTTAARRPPLGPRFAHLLTSTGLSNLTDGLLLVGVPLLALTLTREPALISMVTVASTLPWLLLSLYAGVLLDRHDRVRTLALALAARSVVLVALTVAALTGHLSIGLLLGLVLLLGCAEVFADSAAAVLVPGVVPRARLSAANSRLLGVQQVMNSFVGGPGAGALLAVGTGWLFGVPAALCVVALAVVLRGLTGARAPAPRVVPPRRSMRTEVAEGLRYLWGHRVVRPLLVGGTVLNVASAAYFSVFVVWAVGPGSRVGVPSELFGLLLVGLALGAVTGAAVTERLQRSVSDAHLIGAAWLTNSALLAVPVLVPHPVAIAGALVLIGFTNMVGNVVTMALRQRLIPQEILGRVGGASRTVSYGSMPFGAAAGGLVGQTLGLPTVFLGAVVLGVVTVLWVIRVVPQSLIDVEDARALARVESASTPPVA